jgi:hypothetical protein
MENTSSQLWNGLKVSILLKAQKRHFSRILSLFIQKPAPFLEKIQ